MTISLAFLSPTGNSSTSSGSTLVLSGIAAAIGTMLILGVAADNAGTAGVASLSSTVTDSLGNTWTSRGITNRTQASAASDGTTLGIWTCEVTSALSSTDTVTISFSPATTAKAAAVMKATLGVGEQIVVVSAGSGGTGSGTTWSTGAVSVTTGHAIVAFTAMENTSGSTADSDTTNGSWSTRLIVIATTGTAATSQSITGQYKVATATGNQTYDGGTASAKDYAYNYIIIASRSIITAGGGSFSIAGTDAGFSVIRNLVADSGSFPFIGTAAGLQVSRFLSAGSGQFDISGTDTTISDRVLVAESGSFLVQGPIVTPASRIVHAVAEIRTAATLAEVRSCVMADEDRVAFAMAA